MYFVNVFDKRSGVEKVIVSEEEVIYPEMKEEEETEGTPIGISSDTFGKMLLEKLPERLPESLRGGEIIIQDVHNPNVCYVGLCVKKEGERLSPLVNLDTVLETYWNKTEDEIIDKVVELLSTETPKWNLPDFDNYEAVKDKLFVRVQGIEGNEQLLLMVPWRKVADMAMTASIFIGDSPESFSSTLINNELVKVWGVTADEVLDAALKNTPKLFPVKVMDFGDVVGAPFDDSTAMPAYILSNQSGVNGAAAMLYEGILDVFCEAIGGGIMILPSSIHEVIIIPQNDEQADAYVNIVKDINKAVVEPRDKLTDSVYQYDTESHTIRKV